MREPFHITDENSFKNQVSDVLKTVKKAINLIKPEMIAVPLALEIPRKIDVDID